MCFYLRFFREGDHYKSRSDHVGNRRDDPCLDDPESWDKTNAHDNGSDQSKETGNGIDPVFTCSGKIMTNDQRYVVCQDPWRKKHDHLVHTGKFSTEQPDPKSGWKE